MHNEGNKIIVDLDPFLDLIEPICLKYRPIEFGEYLLFVHGKRLPLKCRALSGDYPANMISNEPFHPIVSAGLVSEVLKFALADKNCIDLFRENPIGDYKGESYIPEGRSIDEVVSIYFEEKINDEDIFKIVSICRKILKYLKQHNIPGDKILDINIDERWFIITPKDNISFYRMKEAGYVRGDTI